MNDYYSYINNRLAEPAYNYSNSIFRSLLKDLQGNILKSHGKNRALHIFIQFNLDNGDEEKKIIRQWLSNLKITTAWDQLETRYNEKAEDSVFTSFLLTHSGYQYLGVEGENIPSSDGYTFSKNPLERLPFALNPKKETVLPKSNEMHALIILATDENQEDLNLKDHFLDEVNVFVNPEHEEISILRINLENGIHNPLGIAYLQHGTRITYDTFGFKEGTINPLFFPNPEKLEVIPHTAISRLNKVLVRDPFGRKWNSCGSFMSFLKFEMDAREFERATGALEENLNTRSAKIKGYIAGRYPRTTGGLSNKLIHKYKECPGHNSHVSLSQESELETKEHQIVRRGISFDDGDSSGLLFMSFQANLGRQFEYTISRYFNNKKENKIDPLTFNHSRNSGIEFEFPIVNDDGSVDLAKEKFDKPFISLRKAWYFFAPSISAVKKLQRLPIPGDPIPPVRNRMGPIYWNLKKVTVQLNK